MDPVENIFFLGEPGYTSPQTAQLIRAEIPAGMPDPGTRVVHPCDAFAARAGYGSWALALGAIQSGKILRATGPRIGRSTLEYDIFAERIQKDGLVIVTAKDDESGILAVGLSASFPADAFETGSRFR